MRQRKCCALNMRKINTSCAMPEQVSSLKIALKWQHVINTRPFSTHTVGLNTPCLQTTFFLMTRRNSCLKYQTLRHTQTQPLQLQTTIVCESLAASFSSTTAAPAAYIHTGLNYKPYNPIGTSLNLWLSQYPMPSLCDMCVCVWVNPLPLLICWHSPRPSVLPSSPYYSGISWCVSLAAAHSGAGERQPS